MTAVTSMTGKGPIVTLIMVTMITTTEDCYQRMLFNNDRVGNDRVGPVLPSKQCFQGEHAPTRTIQEFSLNS